MRPLSFILSVIAFIAAASLLSVSSAQTPAPPDVDALVSRWFDATTREARADALKAIRDRKDVTIEQVEDAVRRGCFYKPQPSGTSTRKITVESDGKTQTDCTFWIPDNYDPKKSYPALVICHGTGGSGEDFLPRWLPYAQKRGMIVIAPTAVSGVDKVSGTPFGRGHGYGTQEIERSVVVSAVDAARETWNIDSDRIYLTGVSMGGHCTWDSMLTRTDYFAGAIVEAGVPMVEGFQLARNYFLPNLFQARMWVMQGTPDKDQPKMDADATDRLKALGYAVTYKQYEGLGHGSYPADSDAALDWVMQGSRDVYCRKIVKVVHRTVHGRAYWLRVDKLRSAEWEPRRPIELKLEPGEGPLSTEETAKRVEAYVTNLLGRIDAEIKPDNVIDIKTHDVLEFTIFIHPNLVDMSKPITIHLNDRTYKKTVKPDVGVLLDEARKGFDTKRAFYATIPMKVF